MTICGDTMERKEEYNLDFIYSKRFKITQESLNRVRESVENTYGIEVARIEENDQGYIFMSKYDYPIGQLEYDPRMGEYKSFSYLLGAKEKINELASEERKEVRIKRFKLQRRRRIGIFITAAGMAALITIGAVTAIINRPEPQPIVVEQHLSTITDADDLVLMMWANYAISNISDIADNSRYDTIRYQRDQLYADHFMQVMMNYYNYVDQLESGLPAEIFGDLTKKYREEFRTAAYLFDEAIRMSVFADNTFASSPYSDAIVLGSDNNSLSSGKNIGEKVDESGKVILFDDIDKYDVYVQAKDIPNNNFSVDSLPDKSTVYNNEVYVSSDLLKGTGDEAPNMGGR